VRELNFKSRVSFRLRTSFVFLLIISFISGSQWFLALVFISCLISAD